MHLSGVRLWRLKGDADLMDQCGRSITYLRVSITDRCDLRCRYCIPPGAVQFAPPEALLTADEIVRVCALAVQLGVTDIRLTGGEPLLRPDWPDIARRVSALDGVRRLALTTNGVHLAQQSELLRQSGVQAVNVSLDSLCAARYAAVTGLDRLDAVLDGIDAALRAGLAVKLNCVCLPDAAEDAVQLAAFAKTHPVAVRFIEMMPVGQGQHAPHAEFAAVRRAVYDAFGAFAPCPPDGSGPAWEETRPEFAGRIGWIAACSAPFCASCNRVRLTAAGQLRPCLGHDMGTDLRALLRCGASDDAVRAAMRRTIYNKPVSGGFDAPDAHMNMNTIGG